MWRFHNPVNVHFGAGALRELPRLVAGRTAVMVTFPEAAALGLVRRVGDMLGPALVGVIDETQPNPDVRDLAGLYERFWRDYAGCDVVIAIGGGSTLDTAKALMIGTASGMLDDLVDSVATGAAFTPAHVKPLIAVPTTAGTGSEVTPFATIWDAAPGRQKKYSLQLKDTWAEAAIVDPELTLSLPPAVTLHSALDALSHALEAIWNVNANPISDELAVAAARAILATLPALVAHPAELELRARVARAALTAGLAFSNTRTALAHSLSYEMTLKHGLPHGLACSFTLPLVLARAIGHSSQRDAVLARVFDCPLPEAADVLQNFLEALGVSTRFESYGIAAGERARMLRDALAGVRGKNFIGAASA